MKNKKTVIGFTSLGKLYGDWDYVDNSSINNLLILTDDNGRYIGTINIDKLAPFLREIIEDRIDTISHDIAVDKEFGLKDNGVTKAKVELLKLYESVLDKHSK